MGRLKRHQFATFKNLGPNGKREPARVLDEIFVTLDARIVEPEELPEVCPGDDDGWLEAVFVAQLLQSNIHQIRICYWTRRPGLGSDGWVFAQFAPLMTLEQCRTIMDAIRERGWLKPDDKS